MSELKSTECLRKGCVGELIKKDGEYICEDCGLLVLMKIKKRGKRVKKQKY